MCTDGFLPDPGRDAARGMPPSQVHTEHSHSYMVVAVPAPRQQMASWAFGPQKAFRYRPSVTGKRGSLYFLVGVMQSCRTT